MPGVLKFSARVIRTGRARRRVQPQVDAAQVGDEVGGIVALPVDLVRGPRAEHHQGWTPYEADHGCFDHGRRTGRDHGVVVDVSAPENDAAETNRSGWRAAYVVEPKPPCESPAMARPERLLTVRRFVDPWDQLVDVKRLHREGPVVVVSTQFVNQPPPLPSKPASGITTMGGDERGRRRLHDLALVDPVRRPSARAVEQVEHGQQRSSLRSSPVAGCPDVRRARGPR